MTLNQQIAKWWLRNAMIRHGHPPESIPVLDTNPTPPPAATATTASTASTLAKLAIPALLAATTGAGGLAAYNWWTSPSDPPVATQPTTPNDGSLYQYLEDNGYHLPVKQ
jgi:hypothetical protein